jgi:hypothetical protein
VVGELAQDQARRDQKIKPESKRHKGKRSGLLWRLRLSRKRHLPIWHAALRDLRAFGWSKSKAHGEQRWQEHRERNERKKEERSQQNRVPLSRASTRQAACNPQCQSQQQRTLKQ